MSSSSQAFETSAAAASRFEQDLSKLLEKTRSIHQLWQQVSPRHPVNSETIISVIEQYVAQLRRTNHSVDAECLEQVLEKATSSSSFGGLGLNNETTPTEAQYAELLFQTEAYLESANSRTKSNDYLKVNKNSDSSTRSMTLAQKIFTQHALAGIPKGTNSLKHGDVIRAGVDWIIASELSWHGMAQTYEELGSPGIWRNDRFWIAGDHVVHPTIVDEPKIRAYIETAEKAKKDFKMTEYQGMNYTIMHTEFTRERAEPGQLIIGSDSHTCSAGAVGCLSIGLGGADVMMTLALGETWFKVPESIRIEFTGKPSFAVSGKDVILHILKELKRNTVAAERIVEFCGDGAQYLSVDARFAICNMCTEFGAITGVFVPDEVTQNYINRRKRKSNKSSSLYFRPDPDARYAETSTIDLSAVEPYIAVYPEPDDVVPVSEMSGTRLDGVFIGACTTTEEELVLGGLVLKAGLERGLAMAPGKRHYVPGSLPIVEKLKQLDLLNVYKAAGFTRGPPGCSMCVGLTAEKASEGETWLSSQNRNFKNRMGKGAFGHLSTAAVCAASAFSMSITDPEELLQAMDRNFFEQYRGLGGRTLPEPTYVQPIPHEHISKPDQEDAAIDTSQPEPETDNNNIISSKIITLGDFIDTDALAPGFTLTTCHTEEEFGQHVLCLTYPEFRSRVASGQRVVVAGHACGVGSSRECAVSALKGAGVQAVIARSFAFIYGRNQPSLGLLGIVMEDEEFYALAKDETEIIIDVASRNIMVGGKGFEFQLSQIEEELTRNRGIANSFRKYGRSIWDKLTAEKPVADVAERKTRLSAGIDERLKW